MQLLNHMGKFSFIQTVLLEERAIIPVRNATARGIKRSRPRNVERLDLVLLILLGGWDFTTWHVLRPWKDTYVSITVVISLNVGFGSSAQELDHRCEIFTDNSSSYQVTLALLHVLSSPPVRSPGIFLHA